MGRILVGFDGSPPSRRALDHALRRANSTKEEVVLLNVLPSTVGQSSLANMMPAGIELPPQMSGTFLDHARARMQEVVEQTSRTAPVQGIVRLGEPAETILAAAAELGATEIVIGHKSFDATRPTLGPNASAIVARAPVPVTIVP